MINDMKTHSGGWGKYARKHATKIGSEVRYGGKYWIIWAQSGYKSQMEDAKEKAEQSQIKRLAELSPYMADKYPSMATKYIWRIQKTTRQINYKKSDWFRLLRRVKE